MSEPVKAKALRGLFWSFLDRASQQGIQFAISIVLARLLLPEEFGLVAMLWVFIAIAQAFINSGFGQALIQKQDVTHVDECSMFYFNILVGGLASGILCLAAPAVAQFYNQPKLVAVTYVMSLNLIIGSFGLVQSALLDKQVDFKTQLKVSVTATATSGSVGIMMAFNGFGVWSLVAQSISGTLMRTILLWVFTSWRPALMFSFRALNGMFRFGSRLLLSGLLDTLFQNAYVVVIGRLFSAADLGFYTRAKRFQELPVLNMASAVSRVTFPLFSYVQEDKARLRRGVRKALTILVMFNFPIMIGLAVVAKPLIILLITEKWLPCVPYLRLLCVVGMLYPLHVINLNALMAQGRSDLFFRLEVLKKILIVIAISVTYRWGIKAMIYGEIATSCVAYILNSYYTGKMVEYPIGKQIQDMLPILMVASIMGMGVTLMGHVGIKNDIALILTQTLIGMGIYIGLCYLFRLRSFREFTETIKEKMRSTTYARL